MTLYIIKIDWENNAEEYWTKQALDLWESWAKRSFKYNEVNNNILYFKTKREAQNALNSMKSLPKWSSPSYPKFAPHPIIDEVYCEKFDEEGRYVAF